MNKYDHVAAIYDFAKQHGYKVRCFAASDKGNHHYVKVDFVIPANKEKPDKLDNYLEEIDSYINSERADLQKEEV